MSRAHHTAAADLSSAGAPQYPRQQVVGNHPFDPLGVPVLQQAELLEKLEQTCLRLGRTPTREELVPALRIELTATFGSLRSALLQLGRAPSPRPAHLDPIENVGSGKRQASGSAALDRLRGHGMLYSEQLHSPARRLPPAVCSGRRNRRTC